ncbi:histone-lysine N-methyltransferase Mes-4 [Chlorella sorokiniana]|uniref:Histone-lysine N-methyltransferase Mes-4 n=1 Tax=Chlorella sorokiniana TaxID=3076 RepID=A0A2P6TW85_CHLSO|nr:histone-lysine N-methyltransferase Mes-4 [Chlorella sorokiniana]|eukprot:PRW58326.1 histone-lysine N-methyltransferase Mes-4 [Chlorella sorokiniana]
MAQRLLAVLLLALAASVSARVGDSSSLDARLPGGPRRRLMALKDGRGSGGLADTGGAAARLCALQCLQHACISWHKIYMGGSEDGSSGEEGSSEQAPEAVPTTATECLAQCGAPADDASCLALTFQRLLNTQPLEYSCSSACVTGLLASSCEQCGGSDACGSFALSGGVLQAADSTADSQAVNMSQQQPGKPGAGGAPGQVPMPFPLVQNIAQLSELSGMPAHVLANPAMALAAQQLVAQRLLQQQMMGGGVRPMLPAQMLALQAQQAQMQQRMAAAAAPAPAAKKGAAGSTRKRGRAAAATAAAPAAAAHAGMAVSGADPGGKVVWAKVGSSPWWPAKTLDPQRDPSYPPDADPPRPTSIPIRLFGTHDFQWIGSKRALTDWEEGFAQFSGECDQQPFKAAVAEAQAYKATGQLPHVFYITPEPTHPKAKARGKKRALPRPAEGVELAAAALASAPAAAAGKAARAVGRAAEPAEDRSVVVQRRKKQRLQELGLLPPDDSPFTGGRVAPNPNLLQHKAEWETKYAAVIEERQQELAAIAQRRAESIAAKEQATAAAKAAAEAAAAAAAIPVSAASLFAAAQAQQPSAQQLFMMMQQQAAALPGVQ